ncbi:MAG TPA: exopolysaccharide transport family protein [Methylocystis sp.]|nr:exopolysaccharide transport family protein [Methylocystis sp.]
MAGGDGAIEMDVGDLAGVLWRRKRLLVPTLALSFGLAGAYLALTPPRYGAEMAILVDTRERAPVGVDAAPLAQNPDPALVEGQMRLLTSNAVLRHLTEREQLRFDPDFAPAKPWPVVQAMRSLFGGQAAPTAEQNADGIIDALAKAITVKHSEKSYVLDVEVRAASPEKAERLARALSDAYFDTQTKLEDDLVDKQVEWLDKKVRDLRDRLEKAEERAEEFRKSQSLLVTDGRLQPEEQLKDANSQLIEARGKRAEQEAKVAQLQAAIRSEAIENLGDAIRSPLIEKLRGDYAALTKDAAYAQTTLGPRHPSYLVVRAQLEAMRRQIRAELRRLSGAMEHDLRAARNAETAAARLVADLSNTIDKEGGPRIEFNELIRRAANLREEYEKALRARENVRKDVVGTPYGVVINQPIAQRTKVSPKTLPALLIALAGGLNLFVATALLVELFARKRVGQGASAQASSTGAPLAQRDFDSGLAKEVAQGWIAAAQTAEVLSLPPFDPALTREGAPLVWFDCLMEVIETPGEPYRRAVSAVYDALWRAVGAQRAPVVVVASREAGAGVTTLAASLALFACAHGEKALLLDCDAERPTLFEMSSRLGRASQRFGFDEPLSLVHRETGGPGRALLGALGVDRAWPREGCFRSTFDLIILDCGVLRDDFALVPSGEIDAAIMIEPAPRAGERRAVLMFREQDAALRREEAA